MQSKLLKQIQRELRVLVINLREHFIDDHKVEAIADIASGIDVEADLDRVDLATPEKIFWRRGNNAQPHPPPRPLDGDARQLATMVMLSRHEYKAILRDARRGSDPDSILRLETLVNRNLGFFAVPGDRASEDHAF
ncbi:MAG: hypothetical protein HC806_08515 [Anaerolineae bacterium]|nr:hypothetical protein [Anaerolineae bacterium]